MPIWHDLTDRKHLTIEQHHESEPWVESFGSGGSIGHGPIMVSVLRT